MQKHIPLKLYYDAYYNFRKHCRGSKAQRMFEAHYAQNLYNMHQSIISRNINLGTSNAFIVKKPKPREVFAGSIDKRIFDWLCVDILKPYMTEHFSFRQFNVRKGFGLKQYHDQLMQDLIANKDGWIFGGDIKSFFMSIDKDIVWKLWQEVIIDWYGGIYKDDLLYLLHEIIYYRPEKHCRRCSPKRDWGLIPVYKSLFTNGDNKGLPIGDLISQYTALLILAKFTRMLEQKYKYVGVYMDDFYVCGGRTDAIASIQDARDLLKYVNLNINENKTYLQPCYHGLSSCGAVIYASRIYPSKRIIHNIKRAIYNRRNTTTYCNSMNSYFGLLKQYTTYNIRRMLVDRIPNWRKKQITILYNNTIFRENDTI